MSRWQYFTVVAQWGDPLDTARAIVCRRDTQSASPYASQLLTTASEWVEDDDRLMRYHLLGSNEDDLTDISEVQAATLIDAAVRSGRYARYPDEPDRALAQ